MFCHGTKKSENRLDEYALFGERFNKNPAPDPKTRFIEQCIHVDFVYGFLNVLKQIPITKETGYNGLPYECYKYSSMRMLELIFSCFQALLRIGGIPEQWRLVLIVPIY